MQLGLPTNETRAMTSSGKDDWCTPQSLLRQLDDEFEFGVDASATAGHEAFPGRPHWGPGSSWGIVDALGPSSWRDRLVDLGKPLVAWLNPPYSKAAGTGGQGIRAWHHRAWEESRREALSSSCSARRISHAAGDRATPGARRPLRLFSHSSPDRPRHRPPSRRQHAGFLPGRLPAERAGRGSRRRPLAAMGQAAAGIGHRRRRRPIPGAALAAQVTPPPCSLHHHGDCADARVRGTWAQHSGHHARRIDLYGIPPFSTIPS